MTEKRVQIPGADLHVRIVGSGPPILLVHGFPLDHTMWSGQLESLEGVQMIAPDLRGFGQSTGAIGESLTMGQMADDLARLVESLQLSEPITICGLSMGGYIALELWSRYPDRFGRLILCDTRAASDTDETVRGRQIAAHTVLAEGNASLLESMLPKLFAETTKIEQPGLIKRVREVIQNTSPTTVAAALRGMASRSDFTSRLGEIDLPVLVVAGSEDVITPANEMRTMAVAIPRATYVEVEQAGHLAPLEQAAVVNEAIAAFVV